MNNANCKNGTKHQSAAPARKVVRPSGTSFRGQFSSRKCGRQIAFESLLERDALLLFEFSRGVARVREQPFTMLYAYRGQTRRYTPDFALALVSGAELLIEVKPRSKLDRPDESARLSAISDYLALQGKRFRILSEAEIRIPALLDNLRLLMSFRKGVLDKAFVRHYMDRISPEVPITLDRAAGLIGDKLPVLQLIANGYLACDLRTSLTGQSCIQLLNEEACDDDLCF